MAKDGLARIDLASTTSISNNLALAGMAEWENSGVAQLKALLYQFQTSVQLPMNFGVDGTGVDVTFYGDTAGSYVLWDMSDDQLEFVNASMTMTETTTVAAPPRMVTWSYTHTGTMTSSVTEFQASNTFNGAASYAGGVTGAEIKARHTTGNAYTIGQLRGLVGNADTKNGTTTTAYALEGSIDVSAGGTITTSACLHGNLNNSGTVTTSYGAFLEGISGYVLTRGVYTKYCNYGYYADNVIRGGYISSDAGAISGTYYSVQIDAVGTMSAGGDTMRGLGVFCTPAGVSGAALQGIYSSVDLGTSTHVSGRVAAIEGRIVLGAGTDTQPTEAVLCLDFDNGRVGASITNSRSSYIMLRDRSATTDLEMYTLLDFFDVAIATDATNSLLSSTSDLEATHTIRCMAGDAPLWILCSNVHA